MSTPVTDFSTPIYEETAASDPSTADLNNNQVIDDLNDPALLSGEIDTNADIDAYAAPPPLPDATYRVKIKQIDVKNTKGEPVRFAIKRDKNQQAYAYTALECKVQDPGGKFDNYTIYDRFVSTMQQRNGGVPIVRILTVLGVKVPTKIKPSDLLDLFFKTVAGEPELEVETVWEGGLDQTDRERFEAADTKQPRVMGMHRFPLAKDGSRIPDVEMETALGKVNLHAQVRINSYHPIGHGSKK